MNDSQSRVYLNASGATPIERSFRGSFQDGESLKELAHRRTFRAFVAAAALLASGCSGSGGGGAPTTPSSGDTTLTANAAPESVTADTSTPTAQPTGASALTAAQATSGSALAWKLSSNDWVAASDGQCGSQTMSNGGTSLDLSFAPKAPTCYRNQVNPNPTNFVSNGRQYTWTFQTVNNTAVDTNPGAAAIVWQIHGFRNGTSPCTALMMTNYPTGIDHWAFSDCAGQHAITTGYTKGEVDNWVIQVTPSRSSGLPSRVWLNGKLVFSGTNATAVASSGPGGADWWNFGPYWYRFKANQPQSSVTQVDIEFNGMTLTTL